jgi:hypothetical protein
MQLEAGYRFRTAPRFHCAFRWPERLRLNDGVDAADPGLRPRPVWRPPTEVELALLVDDPDDAGPARAEHIQTFTLPEHLRARWWQVAEQLTEAPADDSPAYRAFVNDVASFLGFKGLPLPPRAVFDVVLSPPGPPVADRPAAVPSAVVAGINLGDGPTSLVFLNLPPARLAVLLQPRAEVGEHPGAPPGLARRFLTAHPDYPLVRLLLEPGEGVWLPAGGGAFHRHPAEGEDLDVWLVIRALAEG